jgi:hypothetical protein
MGEKKDRMSEDIKIDYDNIDVEDIMSQIKKKIASQPESPEPENSLQPSYAPSSDPFAPMPEGSLGKKAKLKKIFAKLFKPISPLIKFLVFPVHQELKDTIQNVYVTNQRIDILEKNVDENFTQVRQKMEEISQRLSRVREYTQLLHNLSHNMVVELTKLKIEHENLKLKARIMEKDFEFLGKREKTLESKVFE